MVDFVCLFYEDFEIMGGLVDVTGVLDEHHRYARPELDEQCGSQTLLHCWG